MGEVQGRGAKDKYLNRPNQICRRIVLLGLLIAPLILQSSCGGGGGKDSNQLISSQEQVTPEAPEITVSIAKWHGNQGSAMSFDWDDNNIDHCEKIAPLFNKYGFKATFGIITDSVKRYIEYSNCYKSIAFDGHEIASHSVSHQVRFNDSSASEESKLIELRVSSETITEMFHAKPTLFIHPGNGLDESNILYNRFYLFSRVHNPYDKDENFIANIVTVTNFDRMIYILSLNQQDQNWVKMAGHGVDGYGYLPINSSDLDQFLSHLAGQSVWVDTHSKIGLYQMARTQVSVQSSNGIIDFNYGDLDLGLLSEFGVESLPLTIVIESAEAIKIDGYLDCEDFLLGGESLIFDYNILLQQPLKYESC